MYIVSLHLNVYRLYMKELDEKYNFFLKAHFSSFPSSHLLLQEDLVWNREEEMMKMKWCWLTMKIIWYSYACEHVTLYMRFSQNYLKHYFWLEIKKMNNFPSFIFHALFRSHFLLVWNQIKSDISMSILQSKFIWGFVAIFFSPLSSIFLLFQFGIFQ